MNDLPEESRDTVIKNILIAVDNVNVVAGPANYERKYSGTDYVMLPFDSNESIKRFLVSSREQLRKLLLTDWFETKLTSSQIQDVNVALTLARQKINEMFNN